MNEQNLSITFTVDRTAEQVFDAIKNVRGWWSEGAEGSTERIGDEFTYRHKDIHYSRHRLVEVIPGKQLVWNVLDDAYLKFTKDPNEWKGTQLRFEISRSSDATEVRFTHVGLTRAHECFDKCSKGWGYYVGESLRRLITTGTGQPDQKQDARAVG